MAQPLSQLTQEQQKELEEKLKKMSPEELLEFQKKQCIFCQIISGKIPSKKLYEDDSCLAILDINPATRGHLLILPKEHYAIMPQIPDKLMGRLMNVAKTLSKLLLKALRADGTTVFIANGLVAGQKAQHFIVHLIPRKEGDGVMTINEHSLDEAKRIKAKIAIENRLNESLGVKKEVIDTGSNVDSSNVDTESKKEESKKPIKDSPAAQSRSKNKEKKEDQESKESQEKTVNKESKEKKENKEKKESKTKSSKKNKDSMNDSEDPADDKDHTDDKDTADKDPADKKDSSDDKDEVSLDDIANLFK